MKKPKIRIDVDRHPIYGWVGTIWIGSQQPFPQFYGERTKRAMRDRLKELCRELGVALMEKGR